MNLFKSNWIDTIFEGRNQEYGAAALRRENGKVTIIALLIGAVLFSLAISTPVILSMLKSEEAVVDSGPIEEKIVIMDILEPPKPEEPIEQPVIQKQTKTIQEVVKHTPPVIVERETVEQEVTSVDELKDKIAGSRNIEASDDGEVVVDKTHSEVKVDAEVVENPNQIYTAVEVMPEYPDGGQEGFRKYIGREFSPDRVKTDRPLKGTMIVKFVVEPDGSLTDIAVERDLGYGAGAEAIRVIKKSKKWKPGIQNGRNVRVRYRVPFSINIQGN